MSTQKYPQTTKTTSDGGVARKGREHYSHAKADARQDQRRSEAHLRKLKYDSLSLKEKLDNCIPGGSRKERAKLEARLEAEKQNKPKMVSSPKAEVAQSTESNTKNKYRTKKAALKKS